MGQRKPETAFKAFNMGIYQLFTNKRQDLINSKG
jgi:hypothetical protein